MTETWRDVNKNDIKGLQVSDSGKFRDAITGEIIPEIWKDINGFDGRYQVSNFGDVRNALKGFIMKSHATTKGYRQIMLQKNGKKTSRRVHRLVAQAFILDYCHKLQVNHKDLDKTNNRLYNLEMETNTGNQLHSHRARKRKRGVYPYKGGKFLACIRVEKKLIHLGYFEKKNDAYEAYRDEYRKTYNKEPW